MASYYRQVFANPALAMTNVDYQCTIDLLPITPTSVETFAHKYRDQFSGKP